MPFFIIKDTYIPLSLGLIMLWWANLAGGGIDRSLPTVGYNYFTFDTSVYSQYSWFAFICWFWLLKIMNFYASQFSMFIPSVWWIILEASAYEHFFYALSLRKLIWYPIGDQDQISKCHVISSRNNPFLFCGKPQSHLSRKILPTAWRLQREGGVFCFMGFFAGNVLTGERFVIAKPS